MNDSDQVPPCWYCDQVRSMIARSADGREISILSENLAEHRETKHRGDGDGKYVRAIA